MIKKIILTLVIALFTTVALPVEAAQSNGIMAESMAQLYENYVRHSTENFVGREFFNDPNYMPYFNMHRNQAARRAMKAGLNDSFFDNIIIDRDILHSVINTTYSIFAQYTRNTGYLIIFSDHTRLFVASNQPKDFFVHFMLDELGSAYFGFSEAIATFFAERGRGIEYSQHGANISEVIEIYQARGIAVDIFAGGGGIAYDTNFERVLENALYRQGRRQEFWDAAMTSKAAKRDLWNSVPEVANLINFDDLQMLRGLSIAMRRNPIDSFEQEAGISFEEFARQYARYWSILTGDLHPEFVIRGGQLPSIWQQQIAYERFGQWTRFIVSFAVRNNVSPYVSVTEGVLEFNRGRQGQVPLAPSGVSYGI